DAGAVLEAAAVFAGPRVRAEKFVQQVTVAMLEVHEVRADLGRNLRRAHVALDEFLDLAVTENLRVACDVELLVENRMTIGHARFPALLVIRSAEASRVGELKTYDQIVGVAEALLVRGDERVAESGDAHLVLLFEDKL